MVKQVSRRPALMKPEPQKVQPHHAKYGSGKDQGGRLHREGQEIGTGCPGEEYPMIFIHMNILKETSQHNKLQQPRNQIRLAVSAIFMMPGTEIVKTAAIIPGKTL